MVYLPKIRGSVVNSTLDTKVPSRIEFILCICAECQCNSSYEDYE